MRLLFVILAALLFVPLHLWPQTDKNKCHKSTEGTEFWFGFMETRNYRTDHYVEITVTAREATSFTITIGQNETPFNGIYSVAANQSVGVTIPWETVEATGSEQIQDKGIHLVSEKPVNVYALSYSENSSDVAVIYPAESLGSKYFAMCYTPTVSESTDGSYLHGRNSEFLIVAAYDTTEIEITPSVETDNFKPKNKPFTITLHKGEVYQVQSKNRDNQNTKNQGDLTGSKIISNKPIAFYSGSLSTTVPANTCCWDHLYEQIPPVHSWGKEFYIVPLKTRLRDRYRIMASDDNTTVYLRTNLPVNLNQGEYYEFELDQNDPIQVVTDKPVMVAQFSQSRDIDNSYTNGNGDPFMIILGPTIQSKNDVTFVAYDSDQIINYFVNIVTLTSEVNNLQLSGAAGNIPIQSQFSTFPGKEYSYARISLNNGTYRLWNSNPEKGFLAYVYGFGGVESYGYGVGFNLDLVLDLGKSIDFNGDTLRLCYGDSQTLDAGPYFDTYLWNDGTTGQKLIVTEEGEYWALTTTNDGCVLFDSIYIKISHPEIVLPMDEATGCYPYSVSLVADTGYTKYFWTDELDSVLSTEQTIVLDKTGSYRLTVYNEFDCPASDTFDLTVFDIPELNIVGDTLICGDTFTSLLAELTNADPELWNYNGSCAWSSDQPDKTKFSAPDSTFTQIAMTQHGEYKIYFKVKTNDGCEVSDSIRMMFQATPVSTFDFGDDPKCEGYSKQLLFTGSASNDAEFFWDLDGCMFVDTIGWQQFNVTVGAFLAEPPSISLVINDHGCLSDTTIKPLGANPVFAMDAMPIRGCDSLTTIFSCRLLRPDHVEYTWNFGNNDISHDSIVARSYPQPGFYDVSLTITNPVTQCVNGFTIDSMIKVFATPVADISIDESVCCPDSFLAIYLNSIDSSICVWDFQGAHESGKNNDSIVVLIDSPMALVTLRVDEYGCPSDAVSKIIKRKPHFDFDTDTTSGCQPFQIITNAIPLDDSLNFYWMYDSLPSVNSTTGTYYFAEPGKYSVTLAAFSGQTQCADTVLKHNWIEVHPKPEASFEVDYPIATNQYPTITFSNLSDPGLDLFWEFGDGTTSYLENPQHTYNQLGNFETSLRVVNQFGCPDTSFLTIQIVPFAIFTPNAFRPDSPIEENRFFMPVGIGADPSKFNVKIYNRWGILIFESNNPEHKWDGKTFNGGKAPMGNYMWFAVFDDVQGIGHSQSGQVLLIR